MTTTNTMTEQLLEALEELVEAIPNQSDDKDWWGDDLSKAMKKAKSLIDNYPEALAVGSKDETKCTHDPNTCQVAFCGWPHQCESGKAQSELQNAGNTSALPTNSEDEAKVSMEEYNHAIEEIGHLQEQLKEANEYIIDLQKGHDH